MYIGPKNPKYLFVLLLDWLHHKRHGKIQARICSRERELWWDWYFSRDGRAG
jgi:hypothetical protein